MSNFDQNRGADEQVESTEALLRAASAAIAIANAGANGFSNTFQQPQPQPQLQQHSFGQLNALLAAQVGQQQSPLFGSSTTGNNHPQQQQVPPILSQLQALLGPQSGRLRSALNPSLVSRDSSSSNDSYSYNRSSLGTDDAADGSSSGGQQSAQSSQEWQSQVPSQILQGSQSQPTQGQTQSPHSNLLQTLATAVSLRSRNDSGPIGSPSLQQLSPRTTTASQMASFSGAQSDSNVTTNTNDALQAVLQNIILSSMNANQQGSAEQQQQQQQHQQDQMQSLLQNTLSSLGLGGTLQQLRQQQQPLQQSGVSWSNFQQTQPQLQNQLKRQLGTFQQQQQGGTASTASTTPATFNFDLSSAPVGATVSSSRNSNKTQSYDQETEELLAGIPPMPADLEEMRQKKPRGRSSTFPRKLFRMLTELEQQEGGTDIASFLMPHGRSFRIHKPKDFAQDIMPKYFHMNSFSSFQRQLNLYDFQRITEGPERDAYYHELFVRGQPILCTRIKRNKIKGLTREKQEKRRLSYEKQKEGGG